MTSEEIDRLRELDYLLSIDKLTIEEELERAALSMKLIQDAERNDNA